MDYVFRFVRHKLAMAINNTKYEVEILIVLTSGILAARRMINHNP